MAKTALHPTPLQVEIPFRSLTEAEAEKNREKFGSNRLKRKKKKSAARLFLSGFSDPIIRILLAALGINLLFSFQTFHWYETVGILAAVLISSVVSTLSERGGEKAFERMQQESEKANSRVVRGGVLRTLLQSEVVVGDLILVGAGEKIPADGRLLAGELEVDQSSLTGESEGVRKKAGEKKSGEELNDPTLVFRGSEVTSGSAWIRVLKVGENTQFGNIAATLSLETEESPLKKRLGVLAGEISRIGYLCALTVGFVSLFSSFVLEANWNGGTMLALFCDPRYVFSSILHALALAITVVVVAVPEGLPMMISVVLSSNMKRMAKENVLVRKPVGIETAGSMNLLFCDKTGTITTGTQSVEKVLLGDGTSFAKPNSFRQTALFPHFFISAHANTDAALYGGKISGGNATDRALIAFAGEGKKDFEVTKKEGFDSRKKFSTATVQTRSGEVHFIKGAPEILLPRVKKYLDKNGKEKAFTQALPLSEKMKAEAKEGRRLILCAMGNSSFSALTLIAVFAVADPVRPDAKESVHTLRGAGIDVIMMTGDGAETAKSIAERVGILPPGGGKRIVLGKDLRTLSQEEIAALLPQLGVVARSLPSDKLLLVQAAKKKGLVVGMTGDGVNDAPSLRASDVGFSMGSGTEVAKDAGDIIIADNSLSSIGKAVLFGRTIFKSIRKFIVFQLSMNFAAVGIGTLAPFFGMENPITIMQMLWLNLIMDTLGGLAFAGEPPLRETMREVPKKSTERILNREMVAQIALSCLVSVAVLLLFYLSPQARKSFFFIQNPTYFMTLFFSAFIFSAVMIALNARVERMNIFSSLLKNRAFLFVLAVILIGQMLIIRFGGSLFRTCPLAGKDLLFSLLLSLPQLFFGAVQKFFFRRRKRKAKKKAPALQNQFA